jgi:hypothetical protein
MLFEDGVANSVRVPSFETTIRQYSKDVTSNEEMWNVYPLYERLVDDMLPVYQQPVLKALIFRGTSTLGDLCHALAWRDTRPAIRPWHGTGTPCHPAGAFLTIRSCLARIGENLDGITPATELEPFLRRHESKTEKPLS